MIAGETEHLLGIPSDEEYDYFLKNWKANRQRRKASKPQRKEARKTKRKAFWGKATEQLQDAGGVEGIGSTLGNVFGFFKGDEADTPEDYQVTMGADGKATVPGKKGIPTEVMVIGGVLLVGAAAWGISTYMKNKAVKPVQTPAA